jgi:hypothetical protein
MSPTSRNETRIVPQQPKSQNPTHRNHLLRNQMTLVSPRCQSIRRLKLTEIQHQEAIIVMRIPSAVRFLTTQLADADSIDRGMCAIARIAIPTLEPEQKAPLKPHRPLLRVLTTAGEEAWSISFTFHQTPCSLVVNTAFMYYLCVVLSTNLSKHSAA